MTAKTDQWNRLQSLFSLAADLPPGERDAYLREQCAGDNSLHEEINRLLKIDQRQGLLDSPIQPSAPAERWPVNDSTMVGRQIGRYRIMRVIASGGMGTVYEAQQDHPRRMIALKLMHRSTASLSSLRRFEAEANILGRLQHHAIAQIHDASVFNSDDGTQPYFAMELIDGLPITDYADRHKLGTRQRLSLLERICRGVEYAHSQGVIHRDLKPANILVDRSGQPKILDFGIARATGADVQTTTLRTDVGQLMGTLPYMSPEQVGAGDGKGSDQAPIDARSDVYALGVIAYELLTGRLPHDLRSTPIPEAVRVIREDDPTPLSSVNKVFRGDLDTIIGKALDKDRSRRYQSSGELAADIGRYLNDEAVLARQPSTVYQARKFARRNKALVAGVAATFLTLLAGVIATSWQWARAMHQRNEANTARSAAQKAEAAATARLEQTRKLVWAMMDLADKDLANLPGGTAARERLAQDALEKLRAIAADDNAVPTLQSIAYGLGYAYQRVGEVQLVAGKTAAALDNFQRTVAIRQQQVQAAPDDFSALRALVVGYWKLAEALAAQGHLDQAQQQNLAGLAICLQLNQLQPPDPSLLHYVGASYRRIAEIEAAMDDHAAALDSYRHSLHYFDLMINANPDNPPTHEGRAIALRGLGQSLAATGQPTQALDSFNESLRVIAQLDRQSTSINITEQRLRAETLLAIAAVHASLGHGDESAAAAQEALAIAQGLADADPVNFELRHVLATALALSAQVQLHSTSDSSLRTRAIDLYEALARQDPDNAVIQRELHLLLQP